jgi:hypothetical protein
MPTIKVCPLAIPGAETTGDQQCIGVDCINFEWGRSVPAKYSPEGLKDTDGWCCFFKRKTGHKDQKED